MCMKKMFIALLLVPMVNAEILKFECVHKNFINTLIVNKEMESMKFNNIIYKYEWKKHLNGFTAKSEIPEKPLHESFTYKNYNQVKWFDDSKIVIWTNPSNHEWAYRCEKVI